MNNVFQACKLNNVQTEDSGLMKKLFGLVTKEWIKWLDIIYKYRFLYKIIVI